MILVKLYSEKVLKFSAAHVQSKCGNSAETILAIVRKQFAQISKTILDVDSFSEFVSFLWLFLWTGGMQLRQPCWMFSLRKPNFSAQKPQKLNLYLLSTKKVLKCSSVHVQSRCRNTAEVLLTIVRKELTQSPRTILEVHGLIFLLVRIWTKWAHSKTLIFCPRWSSGHMNRKSDNPL